MQMLPMVCAGLYADDAPIAVFATLADAEVFAAKYNAERGYALDDGERARVEQVPAYPAGDPGVSGHEITVSESRHSWDWRCTCGNGGVWLADEQAAREGAARHIAHWVPADTQVALPA
jgi:hypothetical protein